MIIDLIGCSHGHYPDLEGGDLLIVTGDLTARDTDEQHLNFIEWIAYGQKHENKYKKVIYIAGNHDNFLYDKKRHGKIKTPPAWNIEYLCDSGTEFEGLKIWGSPWTQTFKGINPHCMAFTCDTDEQLAEKWALIPDDIDILITHSPPHGVFDKIKPAINPRINAMLYVGSQSLRNHVMGRINPKLHCFSHIHECGGNILDTNVTKFVNCSHVNEHYEPVNKPVRVVL
jgi:Icc-related predicted phosphoesterase